MSVHVPNAATDSDFPTGTADTIAAVATAPGAGAIGVVRLSGPRSRAVLEAVFRPSSSRFTGFVPRTLHHGRIVDSHGADLDDALAVFFPGPHSFTGEDSAEIQGHGGAAVLQAVLEAVLTHGARQAERGEFTRRAFLNGRIDLSQAEAVAELVAAPGVEGVRLASAKLHGLLGRRVSELRERLEYLRRRVCLAVDFPDEEAECLPPAEFLAVTGEVLDGVRALLAGYRRARCWREGALVVLVGRVNAGKSSLMNALRGRPRGIVTERPGTFVWWTPPVCAPTATTPSKEKACAGAGNWRTRLRPCCWCWMVLWPLPHPPPGRSSRKKKRWWKPWARHAAWRCGTRPMWLLSPPMRRTFTARRFWKYRPERAGDWTNWPPPPGPCAARRNPPPRK